MKYGYIYITTNLITNKIYIGQKKSHRFCPTYFGSGKILKQSLKKYGTINHKVELIVWTEDKDQQNYYEKFWIKTYDATNREIGMNILQGGCGVKPKGINIPPFSEEHKKKLSKSHSGKVLTEETKQKISNSKRGTTPWNIGKKHSEETKQKIKEKRKLQTFSEETKQKMSEGRKGNKHHLFGKNHSEETKKKISEIRKNNSDLYNRDEKGRYKKNN